MVFFTTGCVISVYISHLKSPFSPWVLCPGVRGHERPLGEAVVTVVIVGAGGEDHGPVKKGRVHEACVQIMTSIYNERISGQRILFLTVILETDIVMATRIHLYRLLYLTKSMP